MAIFYHTPRICDLIVLLICRVRSCIESDLSDTDNIVAFENTAPINQNKKIEMKQCKAIDQIDRVVFSNSTMLSVSINECTQQIYIQKSN